MESNFYLALELFVDPAETGKDKLQTILNDKKREWNNKRNGVDGFKYQQLSEHFHEFENATRDSQELKNAARAAREYWIKEVNRLIAEISDGALVQGQIDVIVKRFDKYLSEKTIQSQFGSRKVVGPAKPLPPPPAPKGDPSIQLANKTQLKKTADYLDILNCKTIYDALNRPRGSSLESLRDAADVLIKEQHAATKKTAEIGAKGELGGIAKIFFKSESSRKGFEIAWTRYNIEQDLLKVFALRMVEKTIALELYERSIRDAIEKGLSETEARWFVYDFYVVKRKCPDPRKTETSTFFDSIQCPECFRLNEKSANRCIGCGFQLRVRCPQCGTDNVAAVCCSNCGYSFADAETGRKRLVDLRNALLGNDLDNALKICLDGRKLFEPLPEASSILAELRDKIAEERFRKANVELDAERVDSAQKIFDRLSFDGIDSPKIDGLRNRLKTTIENVRRVDVVLAQVDSLKTENRWFAANARLDEASKLNPSSEKIRSRRNEIGTALSDARIEFANVLSLDDLVEKERRLANLTRRYPDFSDARQALESTPPAPATSVDVAATPEGIEIVWKPSVSFGDVRYKIVRSERAGAAVSRNAKSCVCSETSATRFFDANVESFVGYKYSIVAVRGKIESKPTPSAPILFVGEIRDVKISAKNGVVTFRWNVSPAVDKIVVERTEAGEKARRVKIDGVTTFGFVDSGLKNDVKYGYLVALDYRDLDGTTKTAPWEIFHATPRETASPITDLTCRFNAANRTIQAKWTPPSKGKTAFVIAERSPQEIDRNVFQQSRAGLEKTFGALCFPQNETSLGSKRIAVVAAKPNVFVQYLWPISILGDRTTVGRPARIVAYGRVSNVQTQQVDRAVYISWDWPADVTTVGIVYNYDKRQIPRLNDKHVKKLKMTRDKYDLEQAWKLVLPSSNAAVCVQIFPIFNIDGKEVVGVGAPVCVKKTFVEYSMKRPGQEKTAAPFAKLFSRLKGALNKDESPTPAATRFVFRALDGDGSIPEIVVVKQFSRPPLRKDDGVPIATIPATSAGDAVSEPLDEFFDEKSYCRCYLANPEDRSRFALLDPPESELKLFYPTKRYSDFT